MPSFSKIFFLSFFLFQFSFFISNSQVNLAPNPNFEVMNSCPSTVANISDCSNWLNFGNTPDYFNGCAPVGVNVPNCSFGYQYAHSGVGMVGLITWLNPTGSSGPNYREYVGALLTNILTVGQKYYMSFFINYSGYLYSWRQVASNKIGMRFSTVLSSSTTGAPINNFATLKTTVIYQDTVNWLKLSGSFVADSAYKYVVIGNFFDDINTDTLSYPGPYFSNMAAYYYIDDVCISNDSLYNANWATNLPKINPDTLISAYPNPANNYLKIDGLSNSDYSVTIINAIGSVVSRQYSNPDDNLINISGLQEGIYYFIITFPNSSEIKKVKIIKN